MRSSGRTGQLTPSIRHAVPLTHGSVRRNLRCPLIRDSAQCWSLGVKGPTGTPRIVPAKRCRDAPRGNARVTGESGCWGMWSELSMKSRAEGSPAGTRKAYLRAGKKHGKGVVLDEVVSVTGWSQDTARRQLATAAACLAGVRSARSRSGRVGSGPAKYSYDATKGAAAGVGGVRGQCGKASPSSHPVGWSWNHGELVFGTDQYTAPLVREQLLSRDSPATIDRYLKPAPATRSREI